MQKKVEGVLLLPHFLYTIPVRLCLLLGLWFGLSELIFEGVSTHYGAKKAPCFWVGLELAFPHFLSTNQVGLGLRGPGVRVA